MRSIGRADEVVQEVLDDPALFPQVFEGLTHEEPVIRMRAADVVEKVTAQRPDLLQLYKDDILNRVAPIRQQEVRWHVAQLLPRLPLDDREHAQAVSILMGYLGDKSKIVKTFSMQALADLAKEDPVLKREVRALINELVRTGSPAMRSRGRKLLVQLDRERRPDCYRRH